VKRTTYVDGNTLSTESTRSTDPVEVILSVDGKIVVDDERDLLNVNSSSPHVGGDKNSPVQRMKEDEIQLKA
jgi:hypothetical protein